MAHTKARSYCFTVNNYTFDDLYAFLDIEAKYKCFGFEEGENGTPHMQGYIQFANPKHFSALKKELPRAHIEVAKGTPQQNIDYCSKANTDDFYEFGDRPSVGGKRTAKTYEEIKEALADPMNNLNVVRYYGKTLEVAKQMEIKQREAQTLFCVVSHNEDPLSKVQATFQLEHGEEIPWVYVEELAELSFYEDPQYVIFHPESDTYISRVTFNLWPRGKPILYKQGYEYKCIKPKIFVIVTSSMTYYPLYRKIY